MAKRTNVFYDDYNTALEVYADMITDSFETPMFKCIMLEDTAADIGLFDKSDIVIHYELNNMLPIVITERIFRSNYKWLKWIRLKRSLVQRVNLMSEELGFHVAVTFSSTERDGQKIPFIDFIHSKDEYITWANGKYV